ncbi:MAG: hypothetical protein IMZ47_06790, partial [Firmicutes bacterium]|nr:hypothetical protein [Bacillota bacterium]
DIPATGIDNLFDAAAKGGTKVLPKDKKALEILCHILESGVAARIVHKLLNLRFSDLPVEFRPMMKNGRKTQVAHWARGSNISDRIKDLINFDGSEKPGRWSDIDGEKVALINIISKSEK